jgi:hypothetical protein
MNDLFDPFAWRKFTESETLAKIKPGDYVYTTPEPTPSVLYGQLVQLERPQYSPGIARKVLHNAKHPEGGRHLVFEDGTTIVPRNGTAAAYRFLLSSAGHPLPVPKYPVCPSCGAGEDNPSCVTKDGKTTGVHSPRKRMPAPLPPTDADDVARGPIVAPNIKPASEQQLDPEDPMDGEDGADELPDNTVKCEKCKGYGVVRGKGSRAGDKYKTWNGALQAKDNGNAVECPQCLGDTIVAA